MGSGRLGRRGRRGDVTIFSDVDWCVRAGEHWVVLGPNGSGKTTLLQVVAGYLHPSAGSVTVLGGEFGRVDLREARRAVGWVSPALAERLHPRDAALDVVVSGAFASIGPFFEEPQRSHRERAASLLEAGAETGYDPTAARRRPGIIEASRRGIARESAVSPQGE